MALPESVRGYFVGALELIGTVLQDTLGALDSRDPIWDFKPYPERFSLKYALAHTEDWNDVFRGRLERTRDENHPTLPDADEGQVAIDHDYANSDPAAVLRRFHESRARLIETVRALNPEDWERGAYKEAAGELTISDQICLIIAHDAYHMRQVLDYREQFQKSLAAV